MSARPVPVREVGMQPVKLTSVIELTVGVPVVVTVKVPAVPLVNELLLLLVIVGAVGLWTTSVPVPVLVLLAVPVQLLAVYLEAVTVNEYEPAAVAPVVETVAVKGPAELPEPVCGKH